MAERRDRKPIANVVKGRPQDEPSFRARVYEIVLRIPPGRVMNYGLIARVLDMGRDAREVGRAMGAIPKGDSRNIPWHRVINEKGGCSTTKRVTPPDLQQRLLEAEGIVFNDKGRCEIEKYLWAPPEYEEETKNENQGSLFS